MKRTGLFIIGISAVLVGIMLVNTPQSAQAFIRPTPTPWGHSSGGNGNGSSSSELASPPQTGGVQGYVYNYSGGTIPEPGITVVLSGGGWQAETVTNSDGFYQFAGLGSSIATLNLKLPAGAQQAAPNLPVDTGKATPNNINLGFYWGETSPLPVQLTTNPTTITPTTEEAFNFTVTINNRSGGEAGQMMLEVKLPDQIIATQVITTHGIAEFYDHRIWVQLDTLPTDQTATITVTATLKPNTPAESLIAAVLLTYREQITPQRQTIIINTQPLTASSTTAAASSAVADAETRNKSAEVATPPITAEAETLIPATGGSSGIPAAALPGIILSLLFIVGLSIAGLRTLSQRR